MQDHRFSPSGGLSIDLLRRAPTGSASSPPCDDGRQAQPAEAKLAQGGRLMRAGLGFFLLAFLISVSLLGLDLQHWPSEVPWRAFACPPRDTVEPRAHQGRGARTFPCQPPSLALPRWPKHAYMPARLTASVALQPEALGAVLVRPQMANTRCTSLMISRTNGRPPASTDRCSSHHADPSGMKLLQEAMIDCPAFHISARVNIHRFHRRIAACRGFAGCCLSSGPGASKFSRTPALGEVSATGVEATKPSRQSRVKFTLVLEARFPLRGRPSAELQRRRTATRWPATAGKAGRGSRQAIRPGDPARRLVRDRRTGRRPGPATA